MAKRRAMLNVGDRLPDVRLWIKPQEPATLSELAAGQALLVVFYLFDWSAT
jgi:peroxiredoxin